MSDYNLMVMNYQLDPLAILNDDTEDRARNIKDEMVTNGVHKVTFELPLKSNKWHYVAQDNIVLYKDQMYVVQIPSINQSTDSEMMTIECHHLSVGLEGKINPAFERTDAIAKTVAELGGMILDGTGWTVGDVDVPNTDKRSLITSEQSAMANIKKMAELFDCDYYFDATLDHKKVHFKRIPVDNQLVVTEGVNLKSLNVNLDKSQLITRIYVFGGNNAVTNRPITVYGAKMIDEDGNPIMEGGVQKIYDKTYIEDFSYYLDQGYTQEYIDLHPEFFLRESVLTMSDYIDVDDLYRDSMKVLRDSSKPKIEVTFDMADKIENENFFLHTPELNEMIYVYSGKVNSKIRIKNASDYNGELFQLKVVSVKTDSEKPDSIQITCRNFSTYGGIIQNLISNMDAINKLVQADGTINTTKLQGWIDVLSTQINSTQSKWYTDPDGNLIFENLNGTDAMKLGGGIFALANSKNPDGTFQWRAFGTGSGFTATELVAGWLIGGKVKFDLEGGRLLIGDDWIDNYFLKFEPATGLKLKFTSTYFDFDDDGFVLRGSDYETLISPLGMANSNTDTITDNVEEGYPLRIPVRIDPSVSVVHEVLINYTNYPFRTYSKGAATQSINLTSTNSRTISLSTTESTTINLTSTNSKSFTAASTTTQSSSVETSSSEKISLTSTNSGGSDTVTSASGGSTTVTSASGGGHTSGSSSKSTADAGYPSGFYTNTQTELSYPNVGKHYHRITEQQMSHTHGMSHTHSVKDHKHSITIGSHSHSVTIAAHSHSITMPSHSHTTTIPAHSHNFTVPSHSHTITMPSHSHSITMPSHNHTITMPDHSHSVVFGILEQAISNNTTTVWVDGTQRATITASQGILDITQWIQTAGWHNIELRSTTMKKITASVSVKSYMTR